MPIRSPASKERRRQDAERRQRLKPLTDKVHHIESQLATKKNELLVIDEQLVDDALYSDATRQKELAEYARVQSQLKGEIESLEWGWMEASEALEKSEQS